MSQLEKSMASKFSTRFQNDSIRPLALFLEGSIESLRAFIERLLVLESTLEEVRLSQQFLVKGL